MPESTRAALSPERPGATDPIAPEAILAALASLGILTVLEAQGGDFETYSRAADGRGGGSDHR